MTSSASEWAAQQWGPVALGDKRLNRLAVRMGAQMAAQPAESLPKQMQTPPLLRAAYGLLNHPGVSLAALTAPHRAETLRLAGQQPVVLLVEDTTELDFSRHWGKTGLGPIGDGRGQGLLLHDTLAVVPETRQVLGLAHAQVVRRVPTNRSRKWARSPEGLVWEVSAQQVGRPPAGVLWVHVSDSGADIFEYMATCRELDKHFLIRAHHNRQLVWEDERPEADQALAQHALDYARQQAPVADSAYTVSVPAHGQQPARQAVIVLAWGQITLAAPQQAAQSVRQRGPLSVWVLRAWEPDPPPEAKEAVEWLLLSSVPIHNLAEAQRCIHWYTCRWLCEDYHQCLKTGCRIEASQLDDGADIQRLLGFAAPVAVRLLQLRQDVRLAPEAPAIQVLEPLMVKLLAQRYALNAQTLTLSQFYRYVALLGGHQGRKRDGPPGWRTLWHGWRYLADLTDGARLVANGAIT
jgi:hypothetical protein